MRLNPLTHIIIASELAILTATLPVKTGALVLAIGLLWSVFSSGRTEAHFTGMFLKVLAVAAFFLVLIHGVTLKPLWFSGEGLISAAESFINIAAPVTAVMYLTKRIRMEELYALLLDLRVSPVIILVLFRTLWLVPRFSERMDEVVTARMLQGMRITNTRERIKAIVPTLNPIFSSMLGEISENSLTLTARGFLTPGKKSHLIELRYRWIDAVLILITTLILIVSWF